MSLNIPSTVHASWGSIRTAKTYRIKSVPPDSGQNILGVARRGKTKDYRSDAVRMWVKLSHRKLNGGVDFS